MVDRVDMAIASIARNSTKVVEIAATRILMLAMSLRITHIHLLLHEQLILMLRFMARNGLIVIHPSILLVVLIHQITLIKIAV